MNVLGFRTPLIGLFVGLTACSAAGETPPQGRAGTGVGAAPSAQTDAGSLDLSPTPSSDSDAEMPGNSDNPGASNTDDAGSCDCGVRLPGIDVLQSDTGVRVSVELPSGGNMIISSVDGDVKTSNGGVDIKGDASIDLGGTNTIVLVDTNLHIEGGENGHPPLLSGDARVDGQLLGSACGCDDALLLATIGLDVDKEAALGVALKLNVALPQVTIDASALPDARSSLAIEDAWASLELDGTHETATITGNLAPGTSAWSPRIPLEAEGSLQATAELRDDELISVELDGTTTLQGDTLWCGLTPLASLELLDAKVTLDGEATRLEALTQVSLHPAYTLDGTARIRATFQSKTWEINVCGGVMTRPIGSNVEATACLQLTQTGAKTCPDTTAQ